MYFDDVVALAGEHDGAFLAVVQLLVGLGVQEGVSRRLVGVVVAWMGVRVDRGRTCALFGIWRGPKVCHISIFVEIAGGVHIIRYYNVKKGRSGRETISWLTLQRQRLQTAQWTPSQVPVHAVLQLLVKRLLQVRHESRQRTGRGKEVEGRNHWQLRRLLEVVL